MKTSFRLFVLLLIALITFLALVTSAETPEIQKSQVKSQGPTKTMPQVARAVILS